MTCIDHTYKPKSSIKHTNNQSINQLTLNQIFLLGYNKKVYTQKRMHSENVNIYIWQDSINICDIVSKWNDMNDIELKRLLN